MTIFNEQKRSGPNKYMMNTTIWILTVTLFTSEGTEVVDRKEFSSLSQCVEVSRQRVELHQQQKPEGKEITASCVPVDR